MTTNISTDLRSDVITGAVLRAIERYERAASYRREVEARLTDARAELEHAGAAGDVEWAQSASGRVRECEILVDAAPPPDFDIEARHAVEDAVRTVLRRFIADVSSPRSHEYVEQRARLSPAWQSLNAQLRRWTPTGTPPELAFAMLRAASELDDQIDTYLEMHPVPPRAEDSLVHAAPRPERTISDFTLLNERTRP